MLNRYGSIVKFCEATSENPIYISHVKTGIRNMGGKVARRIEQSLNLPDGYMDTQVFDESTDFLKPQPELALFNKLSLDQQEAVLSLMRSMLSKDQK